MIAALKNRKHREVLFQVVFVAVIVALLASAVLITRRNLDVQGLTVGWDFLQYSTGWSISFALIPYDINSTYLRALGVGLVNTVFLAAITLLASTLLGGAIGAARLAGHKLLGTIALAYVQLFRNIPLILQVFFWYSVFTHLPAPRNAYSLGDVAFFSNRGFVFPLLNVDGLAIVLALAAAAGILVLGNQLRKAGKLPVGGVPGRVFEAAVLAAMVVAVLRWGRIPDTPWFEFPSRQGLQFAGGLNLPPEFCAAAVAITLFGASFIAEIVRAGLLAVSRGKIEAGYALGLTSSQIFWKIRLPLAVRIMLPTLTNQYVWLVKATSVGIAIGFSDFFMIVANSINHSGQTLSLIMILILGFWAINFTLAAVLNAVNRAIALRGQNVQ